MQTSAMLPETDAIERGSMAVSYSIACNLMEGLSDSWRCEVADVQKHEAMKLLTIDVGWTPVGA